MIGWINLSVEAFIRESFGDDVWVALVAKARACENRSGAAPLRVNAALDRKRPRDLAWGLSRATFKAAPHWDWRGGMARAVAAQRGAGLRARNARKRAGTACADAATRARRRTSRPAG
jgi:hypothetical protein